MLMQSGMPSDEPGTEAGTEAQGRVRRHCTSNPEVVPLQSHVPCVG